MDPKYIIPEPQKWFLNRLFEEHQKLCRVYSTIPQENRKPMMISVGSMEVGAKSIKDLHLVDTANYLVPTSLLANTSNVEARGAHAWFDASNKRSNLQQRLLMLIKRIPCVMCRSDIDARKCAGGCSRCERVARP